MSSPCLIINKTCAHRLIYYVLLRTVSIIILPLAQALQDSSTSGHADQNSPIAFVRALLGDGKNVMILLLSILILIYAHIHGISSTVGVAKRIGKDETIVPRCRLASQEQLFNRNGRAVKSVLDSCRVCFFFVQRGSCVRAKKRAGILDLCNSLEMT